MTFFHQTPYLVSLSKDAVDECIATVNMGTLVIPHPTADDQPKCIACKTGVSLHMVMPKNLVEGNRYELDFCNRLHVLVAEAEGEIFIDNPVSCVCPALRYATALDCESCFSKKRAKDRTGAMCNKGCGVDIGIGPHLLGNDEGVHVLHVFTCYKCTAKERKKCAIVGCNKYPLSGCGGHCGEHATQEQRGEKKRKRRKPARFVDTSTS
jgi:hypothetical protein